MTGRPVYVPGAGWVTVLSTPPISPQPLPGYTPPPGYVGGGVMGRIPTAPAPAPGAPSPGVMENAGRAFGEWAAEASTRVPLIPGPYCFGADVALCQSIPPLTLTNPVTGEKSTFEFNGLCQSASNLLCVLLGVTLLTVAAVVAVQKLI